MWNYTYTFTYDTSNRFQTKKKKNNTKHKFVNI